MTARNYFNPDVEQCAPAKWPNYVDLIVAVPEGAGVKLTMVINGRTEVYSISRSAAASAIGRIAEALSKSP